MLSQSGVIYFYKHEPQKQEDVPIVPASKIIPVTASVIPQEQIHTPLRTIPQIPSVTPVRRPFVSRKPVFSTPPVPKAPERPANPFPGNITPVIDDVSPHLMWKDSNIHIKCEETTTQPPSSTTSKQSFPFLRLAGFAMVAFAIAGISLPILPQARLETSYATQQLERRFDMMVVPTISMPPAVPLTFSPMIGPDGKEIVPVNKDFSIIVPKIGINAAVVASVDPLNSKEYTEALKKGVAHAKTSYFPNQDGAVYLFSHSTNYQWFVKDLNAIFYNLKNLEDGDFIIVFFQGKRYTYKYKSREIVAPRDTSYLLPVTGKKQLILQTCWPPGSTTNRLLIFADLVEEHGIEI